MIYLITLPEEEFETAEQAVRFPFVQPVILYVYPLKIAAFPISSDVNVGTMYRTPSLVYELFSEAVVISNSWFLQGKVFSFISSSIFD